MPLLTAEMMFGDVKTISIPTDAIIIVSLLIVFSLLVYFFNKTINNETHKFDQKTDFNSNFEIFKEKLEDQLTLEASKPVQKHEEKQIIKKLNFLPHSKLLGIGSLAVVALGGASLLGLQNMQESYERINTSRIKIKLENKAPKSNLLTDDLKKLNKNQTNIKTISYINPLLSTIKSSKYNRNFQVKEKQKVNNFTF